MYYILRIISFALCAVPRRTLLFFGKQFGLVVYYLFPIRKKVALKNISIAFKSEPSSYHENILKKTYAHYGMVLMDFLRTRNFGKKYINNITFISNENKMVRNQGMILMTGHLGNWEMILPILGLNDFKFSVVTQIQKNNSSDKFFNWVRSFNNVTLIPKGSNIQIMNDVIKNSGILGLASDQNAGTHGITIPFFDKDVSMPKGAAIFHHKTNAPILVGFCILLKDFKYKLTIEEITVNTNEDITTNVNKKFNKLLEKNIIKYPEQYFWFHRRYPRTIYN